jgi:uncharacterized protein (DUF2252 family)
MLVSPFTFYRGAAAIMAADLAPTPVSGITAQLCGDAHLSNFGVFGTPERQLIFDINDFDETLPGPWEWDVKRMAASFEVMGRFRGFSPDNRHAIVTAGVREYRQGMRRAAGMPTLGVWYDQLETGVLLNLVRQQVRVKQLDKKSARRAEKHVAKAYADDNARVFAKRAAEVDGELRIAADPPVIVPIEDLIVPGSEWEDPGPLIKKLLASYRRTLGHQGHPLEEFRYVHAARKVVGVGSVGTRCYILLLTGRDEDDPLFLQVKEAQASVLEPYAGRSTYPHHGQRVVMGQRLTQPASDMFLGWSTGEDGTHYYFRQLRDAKIKPLVETFDAELLEYYAKACGWVLARAHAKAGEAAEVAGYLGSGDQFDEALGDFGIAYADQAERDHAALKAAVRKGDIEIYQE